MKKIERILTLLLVAGALSGLQAAQVDIGITLGGVVNAGGPVQNARVELGTFTGYDNSGLSWFAGKSYSTLRSSYVSLLNIDDPQALVTDNLGQFYGAFDTVSTPLNTRLFAWIFDSSTASSLANWAIISGGGNPTGSNASVYDPMWLALSPSAGEINPIEAATIYSLIYASSGGASLVPTSTYDPEGANISLVPEPSTGALMMIGAAGLVALRRLRKV